MAACRRTAAGVDLAAMLAADLGHLAGRADRAAAEEEQRQRQRWYALIVHSRQRRFISIRNCRTYQNIVAMVENSISAAATCCVGGKILAMIEVW